MDAHLPMEAWGQLGTVWGVLVAACAPLGQWAWPKASADKWGQEPN